MKKNQLLLTNVVYYIEVGRQMKTERVREGGSWFEMQRGWERVREKKKERKKERKKGRERDREREMERERERESNGKGERKREMERERERERQWARKKERKAGRLEKVERGGAYSSARPKSTRLSCSCRPWIVFSESAFCFSLKSA